MKKKDEGWRWLVKLMDEKPIKMDVDHHGPIRMDQSGCTTMDVSPFENACSTTLSIKLFLAPTNAHAQSHS